MIELSLQVNGKTIRDTVRPDEMLIDFLRRKGYKSVKRGCDTSNCGLCTVIIDGRASLSCSTLAARCGGKQVETLEGLEEEAKHIRPYLAGEGADQCGFCNPGYIVCAVALGREEDNPDDETIISYLSGNLCRCTGYVSQARALRAYFDDRAAGKFDKEVGHE